MLLAIFVIPTAVLVAPSSVSAATSGSLCETAGQGYCLNTANFTSYGEVYESKSGRTIDAVLQSSTNPIYLLVFNGNTKQCVAGDNSGAFVVIKPCSGSSGVDWTLKVSNQVDEWINNAATRASGTNIYLVGANCSGCQYQLDPTGTPGGDYRFRFY